MHRIHRETRAQFIKESLCEVRTLLNQFERCGALPSSAQYHLGRFLFENFPQGTGFPELALPEPLSEMEILAELQYIKGRINTSSGILTDREKTAFFFVIIPEEMILIDTQKAAQLFAKFNVPLSGYVVNRVIPESLASQDIPEYLRNRLQMQKGYLKKIDELFGNEVLARIPEFERDITGLPMIEKMAEALFGPNR